MSPEGANEELHRRIDAIESGYEFMLAYAAQGAAGEAASSSGSSLRTFLRGFDEALTGLADLYRGIVDHPFVDVLARDAEATQSALRLVLDLPTISSQVVDNLNASIHVRALLTDVFLIDEVVKARQ